jgi:hypothetical protein
LVGAGLKADGEGDDFALIKELIDPPKQLGDQCSAGVSRWETKVDISVRSLQLLLPKCWRVCLAKCHPRSEDDPSMGSHLYFDILRPFDQQLK